MLGSCSQQRDSRKDFKYSAAEGHTEDKKETVENGAQDTGLDVFTTPENCA